MRILDIGQPGKPGADSGDIETAELSVNQGDTKQQKRRGTGGEHHVFHRRFQRSPLFEGVTDQTEQWQRHQFDTNKHGGQMMRLGHDDGAGRCQDQEQIKLFPVIREFFQPGTGERDRGERANQNQR